MVDASGHTSRLRNQGRGPALSAVDAPFVSAGHEKADDYIFGI